MTLQFTSTRLRNLCLKIIGTHTLTQTVWKPLYSVRQAGFELLDLISPRKIHSKPHNGHMTRVSYRIFFWLGGGGGGEGVGGGGGVGELGWGGGGAGIGCKLCISDCF